MNKINKPFADFIKADYPNGSIIQRYGVLATIYNTLGLASHNGLDFVNTLNVSYGTPLFAVEDGIVVEVKDSPTGFGRHVRVLSGENEWTYGHLSETGVILGQRVVAGDIIGKMGNSGTTTSQGIAQWGGANPDKGGTHLHLGLRKVKLLIGEPSIANTYNLQYANGTRVLVLNTDNGNKGAVDFYDMLPESSQNDTNDWAIPYLLTIKSLYEQIIAIVKKQKGV